MSFAREPRRVCKSVFAIARELTLGENATVVVDRFVFNPDEGTGEALLKTGVGAFRLATGKISEIQQQEDLQFPRLSPRLGYVAPISGGVPSMAALVSYCFLKASSKFAMMRAWS